MTKSIEEDAALDALEVASAPPVAKDLVLEVATPLYPTEDEGAVSRAIWTMFPELEFAVGKGRMMGIGEGPASLARFRRRLREMMIRDTARSMLLDGIGDGTLAFSLNKQSAVARVPNFSTGGAPLGDIEVTIRTVDPEAIAIWLCELDED